MNVPDESSDALDDALQARLFLPIDIGGVMGGDLGIGVLLRMTEARVVQKKGDDRHLIRNDDRFARVLRPKRLSLIIP